MPPHADAPAESGTYGCNDGACEGAADDDQGGDGAADVEEEGIEVHGAAEGSCDGGRSRLTRLGVSVARSVGATEGTDDGAWLGAREVGFFVLGRRVGLLLCATVASTVGATEGTEDGACEGARDEGALVAALVGRFVGL